MTHKHPWLILTIGAILASVSLLLNFGTNALLRTLPELIQEDDTIMNIQSYAEQISSEITQNLYVSAGTSLVLFVLVIVLLANNKKNA